MSSAVLCSADMSAADCIFRMQFCIVVEAMCVIRKLLRLHTMKETLLTFFFFFFLLTNRNKRMCRCLADSGLFVRMFSSS